MTGETRPMQRLWALWVCALLLMVAAGAHAQEEAPWAERPTPEPGDVTVLPERVIFRWSPMDGAQSYRVQVGKTLLFSPAAVDEKTTKPLMDVKIDQLPPRLYYWRVSVV